MLGCKGYIGGGLEAQPDLAPEQGPSTPTGYPWGVTYLNKSKASDRNELCHMLYKFGTAFIDGLHIYIYAA